MSQIQYFAPEDEVRVKVISKEFGWGRKEGDIIWLSFGDLTKYIRAGYVELYFEEH